MPRRNCKQPPFIEETILFSRRGILRIATLFGVLFSLVGMTRMVQAFLTAPRTEKRPQRFPVGHWDDFRQDQVIEKSGIYLIHDEEGLFALKGECSHLGCRVRWNASGNLFECPCHGSRFSKNGHYLSGPARKPLHGVHLMINDQNEIIADLSKESPVGSRLKMDRSALRM